jgi:predicted phage tail protein
MTSKRIVKSVIVGAAMLVVGCGGGAFPTAPSPLAATSPTVPSTCVVPTTPGNLAAAVDSPSVNLTWSAVGGASDYVVLVGTSETNSDTVVTSAVNPQHTIAQLPAGTYFARVHAHNWCGTSDPSTVTSFTIS